MNSAIACMDYQPVDRNATFQIHSELHFEMLRRSTMWLSIHALSTPNQTLHHENLQVTCGVDWEEVALQIGQNRYLKIDSRGVMNLDVSYTVSAAIRYMMVSHREIRDTPLATLHRSALRYLLPSRYCQSDQLGRFAARHFGGITHGYDQAVAVADWVNENIEYRAGTTDATTSALDTLTQRVGVCRDFAHLGIALCRALSIPARYLSAYAYHLQPPDFHACFEACIGNRWFVFDPTRMAPLNGLVRIANGRDAADNSVATIFGSVNLSNKVVSCVSQDFTPLSRADLTGQAIILEP